MALNTPMNATRICQATAWLLVGCGAVLNAQLAATPSVNGVVGITAVCSRVSKDYVRTRLPDGSFQPEEYLLVKGGRQEGLVRDASIDDVEFITIARAIAGPLAAQNFRPTVKQDTERLLIMVYWGTTTVPEEASISPTSAGMTHEINAANRQQLYADNLMRTRIDVKNATLLGYDSDVSIGGGNIGLSESHNDELLMELEDRRYFVILLAFDFQAFRTEKKHRLLWETRFSIDEARNYFDKALPVMARDASSYFGQDSHGLLRTKVPEGKVLMGEPRSLGEVEVPAK